MTQDVEDIKKMADKAMLLVMPECICKLVDTLKRSKE